MISFPKEFVFGWSQSGFESEMGTPGSEDSNSDWYIWTHDLENIVSGLTVEDYPENGPGYWGNYESYHKNAVDMNLEVMRTNTEWSRIFPKPTTEVKVDVEVKNGCVTYVDVSESALKKLDQLANKRAVEHYRRIFNDAKERDLKFILNMYHWTLPTWIHDPLAVRRGMKTEKSGWLNIRTVIEFIKYVAYVSWKFDDLVDMYSTMNEPNVIWRNGYIFVNSRFPPAYLSFDCANIVRYNLIQAHARAYDILKSYKKPVGVIYAAPYIMPLTESDKEAASRAKIDYIWFFFDAIVDGKIDEEVRDDLRGRVDWIGVNYYTREVIKRLKNNRYTIVKGYGHYCESSSKSLDGRPTSDWGWECYPEGLYNVLLEFWDRYHLPMYVTENGIADKEDRLRPHYLVSHLYQVHRALQSGVSVKGYLHWTLVDTYEFSIGRSMRFGLIYVDYATKKLYWRLSAFLYKEIAENKAITDRIEYLVQESS